MDLNFIDVQTSRRKSLQYSGTRKWNDEVGYKLCKAAQDAMSNADNSLDTILRNLDFNQNDLQQDLKWVNDRLTELKL